MRRKIHATLKNEVTEFYNYSQDYIVELYNSLWYVTRVDSPYDLLVGHFETHEEAEECIDITLVKENQNEEKDIRY